MTLPAGSDDIIPPSLVATAKPLSDYLSAEQKQTTTPIDGFPLFQVKEKNHHGRLNGMIYAIRDSVATVLSGVAAAILAINTAVGQAQGYATDAYNSAAAATSAAGTAAANAVAAVGTALHDLVTQAGMAVDAASFQAGRAVDARDLAEQYRDEAEAAIGANSIDDAGALSLIKTRSSSYFADDHAGTPTSADQTVTRGAQYAADTRTRSPTYTLPASPTVGFRFSVRDAFGSFNSFPVILARNGQPIMGKAENMNLNSRWVGFTFVYQDAIQGWVMV